MKDYLKLLVLALFALFGLAHLYPNPYLIAVSDSFVEVVLVATVIMTLFAINSSMISIKYTPTGYRDYVSDIINSQFVAVCSIGVLYVITLFVEPTSMATLLTSLAASMVGVFAAVGLSVAYFRFKTPKQEATGTQDSALSTPTDRKINKADVLLSSIMLLIAAIICIKFLGSASVSDMIYGGLLLVGCIYATIRWYKVDSDDYSLIKYDAFKYLSTSTSWYAIVSIGLILFSATGLLTTSIPAIAILATNVTLLVIVLREKKRIAAGTQE